MRDQTYSNFDGTFQRLERIEIESTSISAALARVERAVDSEQARRNERRVSGSHHVFGRDGIPEQVNLQEVRGEAKPYQVRQF
jgi:hypothetical protein